MAVYWHGTRQEASELLYAISAHCSCEPAPGPERPERCAPHRMLVEDQRAVNGLLFGRKIAGRLLLEEWDLTATGWADAEPPPTPPSALPSSLPGALPSTTPSGWPAPLP